MPGHAGIAVYITAFWWKAALFAAGAVLTALLLQSPVPEALRHVRQPPQNPAERVDRG
ncbi:MAG: hypothetical protein Q4P23_03285 [Micrococcaceae bacterium]|nr:hypothetical protein [Micrococcaceae bacterium]